MLAATSMMSAAVVLLPFALVSLPPDAPGWKPLGSAVALLYGAVFLSEPLTWQKLVGLATILGGVALGSGALRLPRRTPLVQTP